MVVNGEPFQSLTAYRLPLTAHRSLFTFLNALHQALITHIFLRSPFTVNLSLMGIALLYPSYQSF
jgi:hypothetical protein